MGFNPKYEFKNLNKMEQEKKQIRVALCGPSGSGKTTLAKYIANMHKLPYVENSAGLILPEVDQQFLMDQYGWEKNGHAKVIALSNQNPDFGREFQARLLAARGHMMEKSDEFVIDRSPIDNVAYFLTQCGPHQDTDYTRGFIESAQLFGDRLTHLIFIPTMNDIDIEVNGSRISNYYYQKMMTNVFIHVINDYFPHIRAIALNTSDFTQRTRAVDSFLST